jgi:hypothetical protein
MSESSLLSFMFNMVSRKSGCIHHLFGRFVWDNVTALKPHWSYARVDKKKRDRADRAWSLVE